MCAFLYILCHLAVQLAYVCCLCDMYEVNYPLWTGGTNVFVLSFSGANRRCLGTLYITDQYTFSLKPKWRTAALVSLGHSTVDVDRELVAIQIELLVVSITSISIKFTESRFKKDIRSYANGKQKI